MHIASRNLPTRQASFSLGRSYAAPVRFSGQGVEKRVTHSGQTGSLPRVFQSMMVLTILGLLATIRTQSVRHLSPEVRQGIGWFPNMKEEETLAPALDHLRADLSKTLSRQTPQILNHSQEDEKLQFEFTVSGPPHKHYTYRHGVQENGWEHFELHLTQNDGNIEIWSLTTHGDTVGSMLLIKDKASSPTSRVQIGRCFTENPVFAQVFKATLLKLEARLLEIPIPIKRLPPLPPVASPPKIETPPANLPPPEPEKPKTRQRRIPGTMIA